LQFFKILIFRDDVSHMWKECFSQVVHFIDPSKDVSARIAAMKLLEDVTSSILKLCDAKSTDSADVRGLFSEDQQNQTNSYSQFRQTLAQM